jgi:hypothetical protein
MSIAGLLLTVASGGNDGSRQRKHQQDCARQLGMADKHSRPYAIHSSTECERLDKQATLAGLPDHLRSIPVPPQA